MKRRQFLMSSSLIMSTVGCGRPVSDTGPPDPYEHLKDYDYFLSIVLDMSSSFARLMQKDDPKAFKFFTRVVQKYFRQRTGFNDQLLIAQLSTGDENLLWDGPPALVGRDFPNHKEFNRFLLDKSTKQGSHVYAAVTRTLRYLERRPGITSHTRLLTLILSDLEDNDPNADEAKDDLRKALDSYAASGGGLGFYWVTQTQTDLWSELLEEAGYGKCVWEKIVANPPLPNFER